MSLELKPMLTWVFHEEIAVPQDVMDLLVEGEVAVKAYSTFNNSAIFTDRRLIVRQEKGLIDPKTLEIYSLPYVNINMWSTENTIGSSDLNTEVALWTRAGHIKIELLKGIDVRQFDKLIADCVLR